MFQAGARFFGSTNAPKAFRELDIKADHDDSVQLPDLEGKAVPSKYADVLQWTPEWTTWPDFERVCLCAVAAMQKLLLAFPDSELSFADHVA